MSIKLAIRLIYDCGICVFDTDLKGTGIMVTVNSKYDRFNLVWVGSHKVVQWWSLNSKNGTRILVWGDSHSVVVESSTAVVNPGGRVNDKHKGRFMVPFLLPRRLVESIVDGQMVVIMIIVMWTPMVQVIEGFQELEGHWYTLLIMQFLSKIIGLIENNQKCRRLTSRVVFFGKY